MIPIKKNSSKRNTTAILHNRQLSCPNHSSIAQMPKFEFKAPGRPVPTQSKCSEEFPFSRSGADISFTTLERVSVPAFSLVCPAA